MPGAGVGWRVAEFTRDGLRGGFVVPVSDVLKCGFQGAGLGIHLRAHDPIPFVL